ncbi:MAG: hypothetical protein IKF14_16910 [Atopobiaceae bacterium]|nr:hypothetical protein [Atopobiaceae bacterium]
MATRSRNYPAAQTLINRAEKVDSKLAADIRAFAAAREYGLVFEHNRPEAMRLYGKPIAVGDVVHVLPERGSEESDENRIEWHVSGIKESVASLVQLDNAEASCEANLCDLVVVAQYDQPIYCGLRETGRVERGSGTLHDAGDQPYHVVINGENYHALQALQYCYAGKVDCIYIDPPYNTGDKNWKYNNDYVDASDVYRHSKWLAWMERRLLLAKKLLNKDDGVLIVTIDEKEYLRLGLLLEQVFPIAKGDKDKEYRGRVSIQMVSTVINPKGSRRDNEFSRCDEYIFFVSLGKASVKSIGRSMLQETKTSKAATIRWKGTLRSASNNGRRVDRRNLFYPMLFDEVSGRFHGVGPVLDLDEDRHDYLPPKGTVAVWPIGEGGIELTWSLKPETLLQNQSKGYVRFGPWDGSTRTPYHLTTGQIRDVESGRLVITGRDDDGAVIVEPAEISSTRPMSIWNQTAHSSSEHGNGMIKTMLGEKRFDFPKSLYAVEDTLRFFISDKPDALVLDFFAGSGTTAHAVMRLNSEDGGCRRCISVTNNEVSADEEDDMIARGLREGDMEWESFGVCEHVTKPRVTAAITGLKPDGVAIDGRHSYLSHATETKYTNREIRQIDYVNTEIMRSNVKRDVARKKKLLTLLSKGSLPQRLLDENADYAMADDSEVTVLFNDQAKDHWLEALDGQDQIKTLYVITDDNALFRKTKSDINDLLGQYEEEVSIPTPMADGLNANVVFFDLTYEDPELIEYGEAFEQVAPLLWMRAGCRGRIIDREISDFDVSETYAILFDYAHLRELSDAIRDRDNVRTVFVVTDDNHRYANARRAFPDRDVVRLYESYLHSFKIASEGALV